MLDTGWTIRRRTPSPFLGALSGLAGGLAASWVMNQFQAAVPATTFRKLLGETDEQEEGGSDSQESQQQGDAEPATVKAAEAVSEAALDRELTEDEKTWAGPAVHYSLGASVGTLYGVLAEAKPRVTAGAGCPSGPSSG